MNKEPLCQEIYLIIEKNMDYEVQLARITTAGKLPDRFLNCQARDCPDISKAFMGSVYSLIEINSPWFSTAQVGQSIINTFSQNYYKGESTSDLDNFEDALKVVNENLVKITQNGETNWIGNLNALLAVVIENKILLAQTGLAEAYIIRQGKINHLTYGLAKAQNDTHPSQTFSNITSGELKNQDKILIANPELFNFLDLDTLRELIALHTPNEAVLQIAKMLKRKKARAVNVMILEVLTLEEASRVRVDSLSDNVHLDRPIESISVYWEKLWQQFLKPVCAVCGKILMDLSHKTTKVAQKGIDKIKERQKAAAMDTDDKFGKEFLKHEENDEGLLKDEEIQYSPELNVHYYEQSKNKSKDKFGTFLTWFFEKINLLGILLRKLWKNKKTRSYILIGLAIIAFIILALVIGSGKSRDKNKLTLLDAQTILKTAEASLQEGKKSVLSNDQAEAKTKFFACITEAKKITNFELVKSDAKLTLESCQSELDKLTSTTRFSRLDPLVTGTSSIKNVFVFGGSVYMVNQSEIYRSTVNGEKLQKTASVPRNNGDIQFGTVADDTIYLYTSSQKVYSYNMTNNELDLLDVSGGWETANSATFYSDTIYLLDGIIGQIYKHSFSNGSFGAGQKYLNSDLIDIKNSNSVAIDGSIYVLRSSGDAIKLQKSRKADFSLRDIPSPSDKIEKPIKIYTDADTTSLYILDGGAKRVVEFDKDGRFVHQYGLPDSFNNLTDLTVSTKAKKMWVVDSGNLYELAF